MDEKDRLIQHLDGARETMRTLLHDLDPQMEIYPTWTIKEVLAHIAGWDDATTSSLRAHAGGDEPATPALEGINAYNAETVSTRQALSYEQVVREWEFSRKELKAAIGEMPEEKLQEPLLLPWGGRGTIDLVVATFAEHEREHAGEIRELITQS
jgi:hypothetical protein